MRITFVGVAVGLAIGAVVIARSDTLRDRVTAAQGNVVVMVISDRQPTTLAQVLAETDLVVRGRVGEGVSRLSPDERDILTTYKVVNPTVAFAATPPQATRPGVVPRAISVTVHGGTVPIGAFTATVTYRDVPELKGGMEIIALLKDRDGKYAPAGGDGLFAVRDVHVALLSPSSGALKRFSGVPADDFVRQIVTLRQNAARK